MGETTEKRSPDELNQLKAQWMTDPCWDIAATPGFEAHRAELESFERVTEARWEQERRQRLGKRAEQLGCPGNLALAEHVESLEHRLAALRDRLEKLEIDAMRDRLS